MSKEIKVDIRGLVPTPSGCGVFLTSGEKTIAIFVDHSVAAAITMFLHDVKKPRPLTHDLIANVFAGLSITVEKVVICDLKSDTYYARLFLKQENELGKQYVEIDARPSDSIAIALQQSTPIYVSDHVWERADDMSWALEQALESSEPDEPGEGGVDVSFETKPRFLPGDQEEESPEEPSDESDPEEPGA